ENGKRTRRISLAEDGGDRTGEEEWQSGRRERMGGGTLELETTGWGGVGPLPISQVAFSLPQLWQCRLAVCGAPLQDLRAPSTAGPCGPRAQCRPRWFLGCTSCRSATAATTTMSVATACCTSTLRRYRRSRMALRQPVRPPRE